MDRKERMTITKIRLDSDRRVEGEGKSRVLLYDPSKDCYYEVTIEMICSALLKKIDERLSAAEGRISDMLSGAEARFSEMESTQKDFIAETSKTIDTLIDMVKNN